MLRPVGPPDVPRVAAWLAARENFRWLDFGHGVRTLSEVTLHVMLQRDVHALRLFTPDGDTAPIGIVALSDIDREFGTARVWGVLGEKRWAAQGCTTRAVSDMLREGFFSLGLQAINSWAVVENVASIRLMERLGFRRIGVQRQCHRLDGRLTDRVHYDLLASEYGASQGG